MDRSSKAAAQGVGHEAAGTEGAVGAGQGPRHARNVQLLRDLDALRVADPAAYADAMALLDDLEQAVLDRKK